VEAEKVIIEDSLNICSGLRPDRTDRCNGEWAVTVTGPEQAARFPLRQCQGKFDAMITVRDQSRPAPWQKEYAMPDVEPEVLEGHRQWVNVGSAALVPKDGGAVFKSGRHQIAVFNFARRNEWYACQNLCPHKQEMVLSRGITGDTAGIPKVTCPMHKKSFSLQDGHGLGDDIYSIQTFEVKVEEDDLMVELPSEENLDRLHICDTVEPCACFA
jgi:NAD(P)H-dependent nitrite reductase small subunit